MSAGTFPQMPLAAYGGPFSSGRYMKTMIGLSLLLHLALLLLIAGLRLPNKMERPLAAYQVSLVTMPTPPSVEPKHVSQPVHPEPSKAPEPPKIPEPPVTRPTQQVVKETSPPPPQPVRLAPTPHVRALEPIAAKPIPIPVPPAPAPKVRQEAPPPAPVPPPVMRQIETKPVQVPMPLPPRPVLNRDVLRGIAPPDVPKLGQVNPIPAGTPKETRSQTQTDVQKILNNLTVPDSTSTATQHTTPQPARISPPRSSMSEEVTRQLQKLDQMPPKIEPSKAATMPESQVASKPPAARTPVTTLQASGVAAGNPYLALVQRKISEHWSAPQVGASGEQFQVVVKFRLDKTGQVSGIVVERTSGNEYYDLAARRAVLSANPLPSFPPDMSQPYFDAHFSFAVGEPVS
ncbi:MAG: TonB family protein [Nitrospirota bacterium]|nr:TonB family protein [Nitrospirota bacterium]